MPPLHFPNLREIRRPRALRGTRAALFRLYLRTANHDSRIPVSSVSGGYYASVVMAYFSGIACRVRPDGIGPGQRGGK